MSYFGSMTKKKRGTRRATQKNPPAGPPGRGRPPPQRARHPKPRPVGSTESPRYTPPRTNYRIRPRWHRVVGWAGVALGILIAVANDTMLIADDLTLLPFGHQELYLILGVMVAGGSTWFLGLFDRGTTIYD